MVHNFSALQHGETITFGFSKVLFLEIRLTTKEIKTNVFFKNNNTSNNIKKLIISDNIVFVVASLSIKNGRFSYLEKGEKRWCSCSRGAKAVGSFQSVG